MKDWVGRRYYAFSDWVRTTPLADVPGVKAVHRVIVSVIDRLVTDAATDPQWISYGGSQLFVDPADHVSEVIYKSGRYEPAVRDSIRRILDNGDIAVDVGGHIGHHTITMRESVGEDGLVLVFEPHPRNSGYIERTIEKNEWGNVEIYEKALSDEADSSILVENPTNTGGSTLKSNEDNGYTIEIVKFSELFETLGMDTIDLFKIDVEGSEIDIIRDIKQILPAIENIILEIHTKYLSEREKEELFAILSSTGKLQALSGKSIETDEAFREITHGEQILWRNEDRPL